MRHVNANSREKVSTLIHGRWLQARPSITYLVLFFLFQTMYVAEFRSNFLYGDGVANKYVHKEVLHQSNQYQG
jgi:hypothetical protein